MRRDAPLDAILRLRLGATSASRLPFLIAAPTRSRLAPITIAALAATPSRARHYSSASAAQRVDTPPASSTKPSPPTPSSHVNPPSTTRPPPLELPTRGPETSTFAYLFSTGKAYLTFYKTGLRHILTNHRLRSSPSAPPPGTRAALLLHARSTHDVRRLPLFGLLLLVCGEFTPLVVLAVPSIVPLTCRIPKQVDKLLAQAEERRARTRDEFRWKAGEGSGWQNGELVSLQGVEGYLARVMGVASPFWDRLGVTLPAGWVGRRVKRRLEFLKEDDRLLVEAGGATVLEPEEARLACADRGIAVLGLKNNQQCVALLEWWLMVAATPELSAEERELKMAELLLSDTREWPRVAQGRGGGRAS